MKFPDEELFRGDYALELLSLSIGTDIKGMRSSFLYRISSDCVNREEMAEYFPEQSLYFGSN